MQCKAHEALLIARRAMSLGRQVSTRFHLLWMKRAPSIGMRSRVRLSHCLTYNHTVAGVCIDDILGAISTLRKAPISVIRRIFNHLAYSFLTDGSYFCDFNSAHKELRSSARHVRSEVARVVVPDEDHVGNEEQAL